jgi:hypothetical protein
MHINRAATFFFCKNIFFLWKVGKNIFWPPRLPPATPSYPGFRVTKFSLVLWVDRWSPKKTKGAFPRPKIGRRTIIFISTKMDQRCSGGFLGLQWGGFFVLSEKWVDFWKNFGKSQKCPAKKNLKNSKPVPLHTSFAHQCSCNICFSQKYFFSWESWEKYFLAPRLPPATPSYPKFRVTKCWPLRGVNRWSSEKSKGAFPGPKIGSRRNFFISTKMDQRCSGRFLGLP